MQALRTWWQVHPPAPVLLARICRAVGVEVATRPLPPAPPAPRPQPQIQQPQHADQLLQQLAAKGLPVQLGRPDDPMLDLLDLPPTPSASPSCASPASPTTPATPLTP